jgi:metal-responsive CopG/Arc/MetJ family transcriptional regulator
LKKFKSLIELIIQVIQEGQNMKTLRISDDVHQKLTALLGELTAQTSRLQTYQDAIEALLNQSVILPPELLREVDAFIEKNRHKGYTRREEFIRQAVRFFLRWESSEYEYIEIPKEKYDKLNEAVKEMGMPYYNAAEFIEDQIDKVLEQYEKLIKEEK